MLRIDLNCDLGEQEGDAGRKLDSAILPWITSANVACGAHAGSQDRMHQLAAECRQHNVAFGAHPGYPDRAGFGRRVISMPRSEMYEMICQQIELAVRVAQTEGVPLTHVKPHGALYNLAAADPEVARTIVAAMLDTTPGTCLFALSGSQLIHVGQVAGIVTLSEVFADRNYQHDGTLVPRENPDAVLHDPEIIADRAVQMATQQTVCDIAGQLISITAQTICLHSDTAGAVDIARRIRQRFISEGIPL